MDITTAVALRDKALYDLEVAERMIKEVAANLDLCQTINDLDDKITALENARNLLWAKLLKQRVKEGLITMVTIKEASILTGMAEMSLRTYANPSRSNRLELVKVPGDLVKITIKSLLPYIKYED